VAAAEHAREGAGRRVLLEADRAQQNVRDRLQNGTASITRPGRNQDGVYSAAGCALALSVD
jgi:hypothetical protein